MAKWLGRRSANIERKLLLLLLILSTVLMVLLYSREICSTSGHIRNEVHQVREAIKPERKPDCRIRKIHITSRPAIRRPSPAEHEKAIKPVSGLTGKSLSARNEEFTGEAVSMTVTEEQAPIDRSNVGFSGPDSIRLTGETFTGTVVRTFPAQKVKFASFMPPVSSKRNKRDVWCQHWAVLTTILEPTEAVRRQVRLNGWCLVIVADKKSPEKYETGWVPGEGNNIVIYLSPDMQESMENSFVKRIPWNHFGRKNIGYLYAIMHGATTIWDFNDDNMLKFWIPGAAPEGAPSIHTAIPATDDKFIHALEPQDHCLPTFNPYPILGAPTVPSWPRGLPLSHIKHSDSAVRTVEVKRASIAVLQSPADHHPDVDAIYQMTMPIPFSFKRTTETKPLMVPTGVLTPYNAQATLHFEAGFLGLLLPITVHERVSDIWRSYFAQRLFWDIGLKVGFVARPLVVQHHSPQANLGGLDAERHLIMRSKKLVEFLGSWSGKGVTVVERMEELWIALYERRYIEEYDVEIVQLWLQTLLDTGYRFPELKTATVSISLSPEITAQDHENVENGDTCKTSKKITIWTSDIHDGTRTSIPSLLANLGHNSILAGAKLAEGPYPFVFEMKEVNLYSRISPTLKIYTTHSTGLTEKMTRDNFEFYKEDEQIASADVFVCSFPPSMCEMWMPFNKTILFMPGHRYNLGRCTSEEWNRLNEHLYTLASMDSPRHIFGACSVYDVEYLHYYTGLDALPLFSFSGFYTTGNSYAPTRDEILVFAERLHMGIVGQLETGIRKFKTQYIRKLYTKYTLSDLVSHRAIVLLPYSVMSYKLTELYSLAIPLFMPSMKFMQTFKSAALGPDRSSLSEAYCKSLELDSQMKRHPSSSHPYSPNVEAEDDPEAEYYWMQLADFFQWPYITHFDDIQDLEQKLAEADFDRIHRLMAKEVERRKGQVLNTWCKALEKVDTGRRVPQDYTQALQALYGVSRLQG